MNTHNFKVRAFMALVSFIAGINISGCGSAQGKLYAANPTPYADVTAPVIDAIDIRVPCGTSLKLEEIASISDDQDDSPTLEITSVQKIEENENTSSAATTGTTTSSESSTAATTASTEEYSVPIEMDPITKPAMSEDSNQGSSEQASTTSTAQSTIGSTEIAPVEEPQPADSADDTALLFSDPGLYRVVLTGTDHSGNKAQKEITITVFDDTADL